MGLGERIVSRHLPLMQIIVIAAVGFAVYANTLNGAFVWDDNHLIKDNVHIRSAAYIPELFTKGIGSGGGSQ